MVAVKGVTILGATGSIGRSTLDVVRRHPDRYRIVALTALNDVPHLLQQCIAHHPQYAVLVDAAAAAELRQQIHARGLSTQVLTGVQALEEVAVLPETDYVMAAIVGAAGLLSTLAAARAGKRVMLANKEALVMTGALFMEAVRRHGADLLPIDSEHNALFQCMPQGYRAGQRAAGVRRLLLTCSGGPFRGWSPERLSNVTPDQACAHPTWKMGRKISVDSATLMNKGLEVNEARWLFDMPAERIEVVVHPQSVVHSAVEYADGSVLAQLGNPDMRTPIACGLAWPERIEAGIQPLDLFKTGHLDFEPPDRKGFPCLELAIEAARTGGMAPAILNAANETAVAAFLDRQLPFVAIAAVVAETLEHMDHRSADSIESVLECDRQARALAAKVVTRLSGLAA